jgi:hypothetical protein
MCACVWMIVRFVRIHICKNTKVHTHLHTDTHWARTSGTVLANACFSSGVRLSQNSESAFAAARRVEICSLLFTNTRHCKQRTHTHAHTQRTDDVHKRSQDHKSQVSVREYDPQCTLRCCLQSHSHRGRCTYGEHEERIGHLRWHLRGQQSGGTQTGSVQQFRVYTVRAWDVGGNRESRSRTEKGDSDRCGQLDIRIHMGIHRSTYTYTYTSAGRHRHRHRHRLPRSEQKIRKTHTCQGHAFEALVIHSEQALYTHIQTHIHKLSYKISLTHSLTHALSLALSVSHSFNQSLTHSLTHSLIHSLIHSHSLLSLSLSLTRTQHKT